MARLGLADLGCRLVDVAPTCWRYSGPPASDRLLSHQDGEVFEPVVAEPGAARHLIGFLWDGANPNVLYDLVARGEAPNVARLIESGHRVPLRRARPRCRR